MNTSDTEKEYRKSEKKSSKKRSTPASAPKSESSTVVMPSVPDVVAADHANGVENVDLKDDNSTTFNTTTTAATSVAAKINTAVTTE